MNTVVSLANGPRALFCRCRKVATLPIGSCHAGAGTGAPAHLLGSLPRRHDFGAPGAALFKPRAQITRQRHFGRHFGDARGDALRKIERRGQEKTEK
jgi:hypothetical protein